MSELYHYDIETRNPGTGYWEVILPIKPAYKFEIKSHPLKIMWFVFERKRTTITNEKEASLAARKRAIYHARAFNRRKPIRITKVTNDCGYLFGRTIWEDGKFLDC